MKSKSITALMLSLMFLAGCGSSGDSGGSSSSSVNVQVNGPSGSGSGSSSLSKSFGIGKSLPNSASATSCTINATTGSTTTSETATVVNGVASVTFNNLASGDYTFCALCTDSSGTVNGVPVGFTGCSAATPVGSGSVSVPIDTLYLNLASRSAGVATYCRVSQNTGSQAQIVCGFNGALTNTQKAAATCNLELDELAATEPSIVASNTTNGRQVGALGAYFMIGPGVSAPDCWLYSGDGKQLKLSGSWTTDSAGNTVANCTLGTTQLVGIVEAAKNAKFAASCSTTGTSGWVLIPSSGLAEFDLGPMPAFNEPGAGGTNSVSTLTADGGSCSQATGAITCESGFCATNNICAPAQSLLINDASTVSVSVFPADQSGMPQTQSTSGCMSADGTIFYQMNNDNGAAASEIDAINVSTGALTVVYTEAINTFSPRDCVADPSGTYLYVTNNDPGGTDYLHVRRYAIAGWAFTYFAGAGAAGVDCGAVTCNKDGTGNAARFGDPDKILIDHAGENLYVIDGSEQNGNSSIRKIVIATAAVTTIVGGNVDTTAVSPPQGQAGFANGTGTAATFDSPSNFMIDPTDSFLYITDDTNQAVRKVVLTNNVVTTYASNADTISGGFSEPTGTYYYVLDTVLFQYLAYALADPTGSTVSSFDLPTGVLMYLIPNPTGTIFMGDSFVDNQLYKLE